ncbi:Subtilase family protein [Lentibacillus halodurans]|uniref:Subtilase family protein n=1 Tax=Lentibacillus halodurans TaxID=237679 RepID=A0A1I0W3Z3_9BACI|nr:S8 family peptidase [Lentibacillus halodurans]SFA83274.1 Subtilase family protein [Lentibacillus halodurans]
MNDRPILILPKPTSVDRSTRKSMIGKINYPKHDEQVKRILPKFKRLENAIDNRKGTISESVVGIDPEYALVFETVGTIENFVNAVKKVEGLEWLTEIEEYIDSDDNFYAVKDGEKVDDKKLNGRLFLMMSDQQAMRELQSLWNKYQNNENFEHGYGRWKLLFSQLKDLRLWDVQDRFYNTGLLEVLEEKISIGQEIIKFEIELWFRNEKGKRYEASNSVKKLVTAAQGKVINESIIEDISYHALLVETPITLFDDLKDESSIMLIKSESIMYFRPVGQSMVDFPEDDNEVEESLIEYQNSAEKVSSEPVIALLDGFPLQNHELLKDRLIIDDPDNYETAYQAKERIHGTTMASLIIHGELDRNDDTLLRPIYVRPIMKPNPMDFNGNSEHIPEDILPVDLIHRAVKRIFEGEGEESAVAPNIKIINLSIGDQSRPFDLQMSPMAKLLDFLSIKYNVLFIVSAGNYPGSIKLDVERDHFQNVKDEPFIEHQVIKYIANNIMDRRILSPSESINSLCIGGSHTDASTVAVMGRRVDLIKQPQLMSPFSRVGLGYRNSIKPDLLFSGGRQLYLENIMGDNGQALLDVAKATVSPGHRVAIPGSQGKLTEVAYTRGTSNAAALATRMSAKIFEMLVDLLNGFESGEEIIKDYGVLMIKALLVHGASWNQAFSFYKEVLGRPGDSTFKDKQVPRFLGYGFVDENKIFNGSDQKVTLIGYSKIRKEEGQVFEVPLPPSLSSKKIKRRLTVTLTWFTPQNFNNQKYRKAQLWFATNGVLEVNRKEVHGRAVQRGTVQHEIFEGDSAAAFIDDDTLNIKVNCREDAGGLKKQEIPYTIAITLEVADGLGIPIYNEVRDRLRTRVKA